MTHYLLVKVDTTDVDEVVDAVNDSLSRVPGYGLVGRSFVCDITNSKVVDTLNGVDLIPTQTRTRG